MNPSTVLELLRYNTWANTRLLDAAAALSPTQFMRTLGGSYPSIQATLTHIVWAECLWIERWHGRSPQQPFAAGEFPSVVQLRARWSQIQSGQAAFAKSLSHEQLQRIVPYTNLRGETWEYPLWRQVYHLVNHSTYHRGQATNLLRVLGAQPPTTDFLVFWDEGG